MTNPFDLPSSKEILTLAKQITRLYGSICKHGFILHNGTDCFRSFGMPWEIKGNARHPTKQTVVMPVGSKDLLVSHQSTAEATVPCLIKVIIINNNSLYLYSAFQRPKVAVTVEGGTSLTTTSVKMRGPTCKYLF